eukprot:272028-Amphidinium_carterae.1
MSYRMLSSIDAPCSLTSCGLGHCACQVLGCINPVQRVVEAAQKAGAVVLLESRCSQQADCTSDRHPSRRYTESGC